MNHWKLIIKKDNHLKEVYLVKLLFYKYQCISYCLLSKKEFENEPSHIAFDDDDSLENSSESYENINKFLEELMMKRKI